MFIYQKSSFRFVVLTSFVLAALALMLTGCGPSQADIKARKALEEKAKYEQEMRDAPAKRLAAEKQALMPQLDKYLSLPTETKKGEAYLRGKLVIVDITERKIDEFYGALPDSLRAINPDEVGTVIALKRTTEYVGHYEGGGSASEETCELKIVDTLIPAIVGSTTFKSKTPPSSTRRGQGHHEKVEADTIIRYLYTLPRKPLENVPKG